PLLGERVGVRGNDANSTPRRTTTPETVKLRPPLFFGVGARLLLAMVLTLFALNFVGLAVPSAKLQVSDGFVIEQAAGESEVIFPMFAAFDERGRLFVTESSGLDLYAELRALTRKCRISVLDDRDGDGRFEHVQIFADNLVFPMGIAWRDGKLYVADPPELVTLEDTDGDGR